MFLWGGLEDENKFHLLKWDKICTPLSYGGLQVRELRTFIKALLGKWLWWNHQEGDALWRTVIDAKFGSIWGGWCSNEVRGACRGEWKFVRDGGITPEILDFRWVGVPRSDFGMIYGVEMMF